MSKKKRFGISAALNRGLTETINVVEHNAGIFRNTILPLTRIELDPDNPRKLSINLFDVKAGIQPDDSCYQRKHEELEKLKELAHTIKTSGVINPIVVYKHGELYRVVAGERRCLASVLAGKQEIEARVFTEKPKAFELKLIQWIENTAREDLTLNERLDNIREILQAYRIQDNEDEITATILKNITGLSLSQSTYYLAVLNAPHDVQIEIQHGNIRNLDKAAFIAGITSPELRRHALEACIDGASLKAIRNLISQRKSLSKSQSSRVIERGRTTIKVNMGTTFNPEVVKTIVSSVMIQKQFDKYSDIFKSVEWSDLRQATKAFRKLIEILELEMVV